MTDRAMTHLAPDNGQAQSAARTGPAPPAEAIVQPLQSADLFNGEKVVHIAHHGEIYRLQTTKLGKLILTK